MAEIVGRTLQEVEEIFAAMENQRDRVRVASAQVIDSARARKPPNFDSEGNRVRS